MLTNIIPNAWRKGVYAAYALAIVALGAVAAGFAAAQLSQPSWIIVAGSVLLYVGAAIGATAASNVPTTTPATDAAPTMPTATVDLGADPFVVAPPTVPDVPVTSAPDGTPPTTI
jgi:ABC-type xylose transport system permease subunit